MADQVAPIFRLPGEVVQHVASLLGSDRDLLSFALTCHWLAEHVLSPLSGVWRKIFEDKYDSAWKYPSDLLKIEYQTRAFVLAQKVFSRPKESNRELVWLEVIQTLLLESYLPSKNGALPPFSKNMDQIAEAVRKANFLNRPMVWADTQRSIPNPSTVFCSIQLCLTHLCLSSPDTRPCLRSNYDIAQVYSYDQLRDSFVQSGNVKLETLLHIRNFWQRHLLSTREQTFAPSFSNTEPKPKAWNRPLEQIELPAGCWTGYYSCIHPYPPTVEILQEEQTCAGPETEHEAIKMFLVTRTIDEEPLFWTDIFADTFLEDDELQQRTYFTGTQGFYIPDTVLYRIRGFYEVIPNPQGRIPGWVRVCFVSYIRYGHGGDDYTNADDTEEEDWVPNLDEDFDCMYGFEGLLLPGGKIMLGHYFDMLSEDQPGSERGPCIYWEDRKEKDLITQLTHILEPEAL